MPGEPPASAPGAGAADPVSVIYVAGCGRSGTTLLGSILNEVPGVFNAGELRYLWFNAIDPASLCGCGDSLRACPIWAPVLGETEGLRRTGERVRAWQQARLRVRHTWSRLADRPESLAADPMLQAYAELIQGAYRRVRDLTGARVLVDTGKVPADAALLTRLAGVRPVMVHIVRDVRGAADSWSRPNAYLPSHGLLKSTWDWIGYNLASEAVARRLPGRSLRIRYEDLVADPEPVVRSVLGLVGMAGAELPVRGHEVRLSGNHAAAGNPGRSLTGTVSLEPDERWRHRLPRPAAIGMRALTHPLMSRYGY